MQCGKCNVGRVLDTENDDPTVVINVCPECGDVDVEPVEEGMDFAEIFGDEYCECGWALTFDDGKPVCPLCCPNQGAYAAGTEKCDWCPASDECGADYMRLMER